MLAHLNCRKKRNKTKTETLKRKFKKTENKAASLRAINSRISTQYPLFVFFLLFNRKTSKNGLSAMSSNG